MEMRIYSNKELYDGIIDQDQDALNYLYKYHFPRVKRILKSNGADYDNANEVFQEAIILLYRKAKSGELKEVVNIENYIIGVCKLLWLNYYCREAKKSPNQEVVFDEIADISDEIVNEYKLSRRKKLFFEHFNRLGEDCKKILMAFFNGRSFAQIAEEMNLISEEYARRRKYLCKENLVKSIKNDPQYEKLIGEYDEELFETD